MSALMYGYSLKEITSVSIDIIKDFYQSQIESTLLQGLLTAVMPFGGVFGSILAKKLSNKITHRQGMNLALLLLIFSL